MRIKHEKSKYFIKIIKQSKFYILPVYISDFKCDIEENDKVEWCIKDPIIYIYIMKCVLRVQ